MSDEQRYDLVIDNARRTDGSVGSIGVRAGRYVAIRGAPGAALTRLDVEGRLVTESFVNAHLHLDKVYTLPMVRDDALDAYTTSDMGGAMTAIERASSVKAHYERAWLVPNIRRALEAAVRNGVLHIQAFVDVDTAAGLEGMAAVLAVREEFRELLDVQVVAFPQDGLLRDDGAAELCEEALRMGADVVGGIPWIELTDKDAQRHVEWACSLAASTGRRVAMLVDDAGDPTLRTTQMLAESMLEHDLVGQGVACHARALACYEQPTLRRLIALARKAGLSFVSDPHTGPLHLPVRQLLDAGLPVALGQDDIEDAYYPFGRNNMLEIAFLAAHLLGFLSDAEQRLLLDLVGARAAEVLGLPAHAIAIGNEANLLVHESERVVDVLREHAAPRWVIRKGHVVAQSQTSSVIHAPLPFATRASPTSSAQR